MDMKELIEVAKTLKELKESGLTVEDLKEAKGFIEAKDKPVKGARILSVNGAAKDVSLHMKRDENDFISFTAKGYKSRKVSLDDLRAGLVAVEDGKFVSENKKTGTRFVVRSSTAGKEKEKVLGENLIVAAKNAGFI